MKLNFKYFGYKIITIMFFVCGILFGQNPFTGLVLEQLNNDGAFEGTTYRIYAELSEGKLYIVYGDEARPSSIETTGQFFNTGSADFQDQVATTYFQYNDQLRWDTWLTIGDDYFDGVSTIGELNLSGLSESSWSFGGEENSDASIFRTPDNINCLPNNGRVLLAQITTDGTLSGYLNLRMHREHVIVNS